MSERYKYPVALMNNTSSNYNYYVLAVDSVRNELALFYYGHLTDGLWHRLQSLKPNGTFGALAAFQNRASGNSNIEVFIVEGNHYQHFTYNISSKLWQRGETFGGTPQNQTSIAAFQNQSPNNFNYELFLPESNYLRHWWFDFNAQTWNKAQSFAQNCSGCPAVFQNHSPKNYNYEVIVPEGDHLQHYYYGHLADGAWHKAQAFAYDPSQHSIGSPTVFQNRAPNNFNYEVVVKNSQNELRHFYYGHLTDSQWHDCQGITNVPSAGLNFRLAMFQNLTPNNYNYELIFPEGDHLQHYFYGHLADGMWHKAQMFGMPWTRLNFDMQHQQQTNWCWSATTVSINAYFKPTTDWTQCKLVNAEFGRTDCCNNGSNVNCNRPWYLYKSLTRTGNLKLSSAGSGTMDQIATEIDAGHPLACAVYWQGGGGHALAIQGYNRDLDMIALGDPWWGPSDITLWAFTNQYQTTGQWGDKYFVKP
jgi:hypothetical protein